MRSVALRGGFADPPVEAARAFRAAMRAMARPGTIERLDTARPPLPAGPAAGTLLLTLCDSETGIFLAGRYDRQDLRDWIAFHTGAGVVAAGEAQFAFGRWQDLLPLSRYRPGTPEYPDRSAMLIVEVGRLEARGTGLRGPGIRDRVELSLPDPAALKENAARYPQGIDFFFTCGERVAALPRSTRLEGAACM